MENLLRMWTNGVWLRQMDWMGASVRCVGTLVHGGLLPATQPSSVRFAATFPPREGFFRWYHPAKLYFVTRAFPWGEGAPVRTLGRMRATFRKESVVY